MIRKITAALTLLLSACGDGGGISAETQFEESLRVCRLDDFSARVEGLGAVYYTILGRQGNDCLVEMVFINAPNAAWNDQPLQVLLGEDRSGQALKDTIAACLERRVPQVSDGTCSGALMDVLRQAGTGGPVLAEADFSESGCGTRYDGSAPARYRMRDSVSGLWGYLDRAGTWVIPPRFDQATHFSDGLAAALEGDGWHVIDPDGEIAIANVSKAQVQSYTSMSGRNIYSSPIRPFSQNCARLTNARGLFYLSRDGQLWMNEPTDAMAAAADAIGGKVTDIGPFGAGLASVSFDVEAFGKLDPKGYIDGNGDMAIAAQYAQLGDFDSATGLAPVGIAEGPDSPFTEGWVFINTRGQQVLPADGSRYKSADAFSEGLAAIRIGRDYQYIRPDGAALTKETYNNAAPFHDGMSYVRFQDDVFGWIDSAGKRTITEDDIGLCSDTWPTANGFGDGLALVVIAKDDSGCGKGQAVTLGGGANSYENGEFAYIDKTGKVVFRESQLSAP